jgi:TRAP-type transport system periplasmic protein
MPFQNEPLLKEPRHKVAQLDKENEAVVNNNGITTIVPSDELLEELSIETKEIRQNWLKNAPPEAQEIVDKFNEAVGRK